MDKFLETHKLPELNEEEIKHLDKCIKTAIAENNLEKVQIIKS